eukprot:scaffold293901_cov46-Prasinocladus_malaysianus.AAC.1
MTGDLVGFGALQGFYAVLASLHALDYPRQSVGIFIQVVELLAEGGLLRTALPDVLLVLIL